MVTAQRALGLHEVVLALVPVLFIYAPVLLCRLRGVDSYAYALWIPPLRDLRAWGRDLAVALRLYAAILLPWRVGYHLYQALLFHHVPDLGRWPARPFTLVAHHLFFVALPEEFFYRGYIQTRLNEAFGRPWRIAGTRFGHGLWIASLFFAFGHDLVQYQWWHFATFFPGLLFGLLRERTGGVVAGAFFHALCNVGVAILDTIYGVIPP